MTAAELDYFLVWTQTGDVVLSIPIRSRGRAHRDAALSPHAAFGQTQRLLARTPIEPARERMPAGSGVLYLDCG